MNINIIWYDINKVKCIYLNESATISLIRCLTFSFTQNLKNPSLDDQLRSPMVTRKNSQKFDQSQWACNFCHSIIRNFNDGGSIRWGPSIAAWRSLRIKLLSYHYEMPSKGLKLNSSSLIYLFTVENIKIYKTIWYMVVLFV